MVAIEGEDVRDEADDGVRVDGLDRDLIECEVLSVLVLEQFDVVL